MNHEILPPIYGIMAEFEEPEQLVEAAREAYKEGYRSMDAFTPYPIEEVWEAIGVHKNNVAFAVLIAGILGAFSGFGLEYTISKLVYPLNIGGRPFNSWPMFIPITFELTVLFAGLTAAIGMLIMNKLPQPYHPVFNVPRFELASQDRFFLVIESTDPKFEISKTRSFLQSQNPFDVSDVEH